MQRIVVAIAAAIAAAALVAVAAIAAALVTAAPALSAPACPRPAPLPREFVSEIDNPYFPLEPGTTLSYRGNLTGNLPRTCSRSPTGPR
jgi:hypothetical protein